MSGGRLGGRLQHAPEAASPVAHLHAQGRPHDEAYVVADEAGLRALQGAIARALDAADGTGEARVFTADGEGYDLVVLLSGPHDLAIVELPYADADALDPRPEAVHPAAIYRSIRRIHDDRDPPDRA